MAILVVPRYGNFRRHSFGVAAPHQNYDVTSRASNDAGFLKNFNTRVFSPKCTIPPSYSKIGAGRFVLVHPSLHTCSSMYDEHYETF